MLVAALLLALLPVPQGGAATESTASLRVEGATAGVRLVPAAGGEPLVAAGRSLFWPELAAGTWQADFAAGPGGKPESVTLALRPGTATAIAVADTMEPEGLELAAAACRSLGGWSPVGPTPTTDRWTADTILRCVPMADPAAGPDSVLLRREPFTDGRVQVGARWQAGRALGVLARWSGPGDCYAARWAGDEVVLERYLDGHRLELGKAPAPPGTGFRHLTLQCSGFRLQVWLDDAPLIRVMDGAHAGGRCGLLMPADAGAEFASFGVWPTAEAVPMVAAERRDEVCAVRVRHPGAPGRAYALCLWLDQAQGPILGGPGAEPFLLRGGAAPLFQLGGGKGWKGATGDLDGSGGGSALFTVPRGVAAALQVVQVAGLVVTRDGAEIIGLLPRATVVL